MKYNQSILSVISIGVNAYAHSGRTDSNGGHRDNQKKGGLESYHYHCGKCSVNLYTNGVCPYSASSSLSKSSTSSSSSSSIKTTSIVPIVEAITIGLLGGGGYLEYKNIKDNDEWR